MSKLKRCKDVKEINGRLVNCIGRPIRYKGIKPNRELCTVKKDYVHFEEPK